MPFTPFHLGPAAVAKVIGGRYFSFTMFGFSQVVIDLEPLVRIIRGDAVLHGPSHSYFGATLIGLLLLVIGKPTVEFCLRLWNEYSEIRWLELPTQLTRISTVSAIVLGVYSHVLLDSIMHSDMRPWFPFSDTNSMLNWMSVNTLHFVLLLLGLIGGVILICIYVWKLLSINDDSRR